MAGETGCSSRTRRPENVLREVGGDISAATTATGEVDRYVRLPSNCGVTGACTRQRPRRIQIGVCNRARACRCACELPEEGLESTCDGGGGRECCCERLNGTNKSRGV